MINFKGIEEIDLSHSIEPITNEDIIDWFIKNKPTQKDIDKAKEEMKIVVHIISIPNFKNYEEDKKWKENYFNSLNINNNLDYFIIYAVPKRSNFKKQVKIIKDYFHHKNKGFYIFYSNKINELI